MTQRDTATPFNGFPREAFQLFRDLARHNDREWFKANQERWERACREPMKSLVAEFGAGLKRGERM